MGRKRKARGANQRRYERNKDTARAGVEWTAEEMEYVTERDASGEYVRTAYECAVELQRSVQAIDMARLRSRREQEPQSSEPAGPSWGGMEGEIGADLGGDFERLPSGF